MAPVMLYLMGISSFSVFVGLERWKLLSFEGADLQVIELRNRNQFWDGVLLLVTYFLPSLYDWQPTP